MKVVWYLLALGALIFSSSEVSSCSGWQKKWDNI